MPKVIRSDNGPTFIAKVSQGVARYLEVDWKLHYRPQSSGQVEKINKTLKETLTKLTMETGADWVAFPLALFRARNIPSRFSLIPFEILYVASVPLTVLDDVIKPTCHSNNDLYARQKDLQVIQKEVWSQLVVAYAPGTPETSHQFQVGDSAT